MEAAHTHTSLTVAVPCEAWDSVEKWIQSRKREEHGNLSGQALGSTD